MVFERVACLFADISSYFPHIFQLLNLVMKGTGAQDCGTAIAFTAIQALEHCEECRIVSLDIRGAFNSVWWAGLLKHLWSVGLRSNRSLLVVAHSDIMLFNGTSQLVLLRVVTGPLSCLICTFDTLLNKFTL